MKKLGSIILVIFILAAIPLTITLVFQRQEIRKKAGEFPPAVVFIPRTINTPLNQNFTLTILLRGSALQTKIIDGMDIVFKYPKDILELIPDSSDKAIALSPSFPSSLNVFLNSVRETEGNLNYVILSAQTKIQNNQRIPFEPEKDPVSNLPKDIVLGTVTFKPLKVGSAGVDFDILRTVVAGAGTNTTNMDLSNSILSNSYASINQPLYSILRVYPNKVEQGYTQTFTTDITGNGFVSGQKVKIGDIDCTSPIVSDGGTKITCTVSTGMESGNKNVTLLSAEGNVLAELESGFFIYLATDPLIDLRVRFSGIVNQPINNAGLDYEHQFAKLQVMGNEKQFIKNNLLLSLASEKDADNNIVGYYYETLKNDSADDLIPLVGFNPGQYTILIKGPKHLQKKLEVDLVSGINTIDRLNNPISYLPGGDLPLESGQDGKVNSIDYNYLINHFDTTNPQEIFISDLNLDGAVNRGDMGIIAETLGEKRDEDE